MTKGIIYSDKNKAGLDVQMDKRKLTAFQMRFLQTYFNCNKNMKCTVEKLNLNSTQHGYSVIKSPVIKYEIAKRDKLLTEYFLATNKFEVTKEAKMMMLWDIAKKGVEERKNRMGSIVLNDPASSVAAIQELNKMQGHYAPNKLVVKTEQAQKTEAEIMADIKRLVSEVELAGLVSV